MSRNNIRFIPASPAHVGVIANRMREADVIECRAMGHTPKQALRAGLIASHFAFTVMINDRAEAMIGLVVTNALCGEGVPWMLGTEEIYANPRITLTAGPKFIDMMLDSTPRLSNVVACCNHRAIRFLKRVGFIIREEVIVFAGVEFFPFEAERRDV